MHSQQGELCTIALKEYSVVESSDGLEEAAQIYYNTLLCIKSESFHICD